MPLARCWWCALATAHAHTLHMHTRLRMCLPPPPVSFSCAPFHPLFSSPDPCSQSFNGSRAIPQLYLRKVDLATVRSTELASEDVACLGMLQQPGSVPPARPPPPRPLPDWLTRELGVGPRREPHPSVIDVLWAVGPMADPWEVILESLVAMNGKSAAPMRRRIQLAIKYLSGNSELKAALTAVGCSKGALGHSHTFSTATTALPVLCLALTHRHTVSTLAHHPWRICVCVCVFVDGCVVGGQAIGDDVFCSSASTEMGHTA